MMGVGSNAHMAGGQVVTNTLMNGSPMGGIPMNGMPMNMGGMGANNCGLPMAPNNGMQSNNMSGLTAMANHQMGGNMGGGGGGDGGGIRACAGCGGKILERFLFHALDRFWHHGCLKCTCCGARLADIGVSCYTKGGMILCRADYVRYVSPLHLFVFAT